MVMPKSTTCTKPSGAPLNRGDTARLLFEFGHVRPTGDGRHYQVTSETDPAKSYRVTVLRNRVGDEHAACTCPDYKRAIDERHYYWHQCKHGGAVLLLRAACRAGFRPSAGVVA